MLLPTYSLNESVRKREVYEWNGTSILLNPSLCDDFLQFSRNHNIMGEIDQDPGAWGAVVAASSKAALEVRYTLLPYLYTLFYHHVNTGSAVFRPLFYNFPQDSRTYGIDRQFMWGTGLLVSPVLTEDTTSVTAYFPESRVYSYYTGAEVGMRGGVETIPAPLDFIHVHVVGGNIIPTQEPARNTEVARNNSMGLIVALDDDGFAMGDLFYDDGESIETHISGDYFHTEFSMMFGFLGATVVHDGYPEMGMKVFGTVRLLGMSNPVTNVSVNGAPHMDFITKPSGEVELRNLNVAANSEFSIVFA